MNLLLPILLACSALGAPPADDPLSRYDDTQVHMGTEFTIAAYAPDEPAAQRAFADVSRRIEELNALLSDYDPESELSRLSVQSPTDNWVVVSQDLWNVLVQAQELSRLSDGAFDVSVGPLSRLWRRARQLHQLPSEQRLQEALAAVGYQAIELDPARRAVRLTRPGMRLDLGAIAKGYAADEALKVLQARGLPRAIVNAGGDIAIGEAPPDAAGWRVGVAPLDPDAPPSRFFELRHCGIATSGDAWQYVEIDGQRYSHIIDPRTGLGLRLRSSVSILAQNCMLADGLASMVSVLGPERGLAALEQLESATGVVVYIENEQTQIATSPDFEQVLERYGHETTKTEATGSER